MWLSYNIFCVAGVYVIVIDVNFKDTFLDTGKTPISYMEYIYMSVIFFNDVIV